MVNMQPTNAKLKRRAEAMVAQIARLRSIAGGTLARAGGGSIKTAVLLTLGIGKADAEIILKRCDGNLRRVFAELAKDETEVQRRRPHESRWGG